MSYFEDFEEIHMGDLAYEDYYESRPRFTFENLNNKWKTKDGTMIKLKDMTTSHIVNSLNMILRICSNHHLVAKNYPIYNNLRKELDLRNKINKL